MKLPHTASFSKSGTSKSSMGFTLVELLLSITILAILMLIITNVIGTIQKTWVTANSRVSQFREARIAFELLTRNLPQATLNTYLQAETETQSSLGTYASGEERKRGKNYVRQSELQFVCGQTAGVSGLLGSGASAQQFPTHGVFFQALLGITNQVSPDTAAVNTQNMVNLLCGRGYFLNWGDDLAFRPPFLPAKTVKPRYRYRLMEYSPTAEANQIYYDPLVPAAASATELPDLSLRRPITDPARSKMWFRTDVLSATDDINTKTGDQVDTAITRGFVRPVAENIIALVLSPQLEKGAKNSTGALVSETSIAPTFDYDSAVPKLPSATTQPTNQHQLPPLIKITLVAVDSVAGEKLSSDSTLQDKLATSLNNLFTDAANYSSDNSAYHNDLTSLEAFLIQNRINYRVFTTSVIMKQARWSL